MLRGLAHPIVFEVCVTAPSFPCHHKCGMVQMGQRQEWVSHTTGIVRQATY